MRSVEGRNKKACSTPSTKCSTPPQLYDFPNIPMKQKKLPMRTNSSLLFIIGITPCSNTTYNKLVLSRGFPFPFNVTCFV